MTFRKIELNKTILASVIFIFAISVSGIDSAFALTEDEKLMKTVGEYLLLPDTGMDDPQMQSDLVYLNSLGYYHSSQNDSNVIEMTVTTQPITEQVIETIETNSLDAFVVFEVDPQPLQTCTTCTPDPKKLAIKAGYEFPHTNSVLKALGWKITREVATWSSWAALNDADRTYSTIVVTDTTVSDYKPFFKVKANQAVTTASFNVDYETGTSLESGRPVIATSDNVAYSHYFATLLSVGRGNMAVLDSVVQNDQSRFGIDITSIS